MPRGTRPTPPAAWRCAANAGRSCRGWRCAATVVIGNGWLRVARCFRLVQPRSLREPRAAWVAEDPPTPADGASGAGLRHGMVGQPPGTYPHACDWETIGDLARRFPTSGRRAAPAGGPSGTPPAPCLSSHPGFRARTPNPLNRLQSSARPPPRAFGRLSTLPSWRDILARGGTPRTGIMQFTLSLHRCQRWPLGLHDGNARAPAK
jgi:hypothetical protein